MHVSVPRVQVCVCMLIDVREWLTHMASEIALTPLMSVPLLARLLSLRSIVFREPLSRIAGANALAPSVPKLLLKRLIDDRERLTSIRPASTRASVGPRPEMLP